MRLISETTEKQQPVLIVDSYESRAALILADKLRENESIDVLIQREFPARLEHFFLIYVFGAEPDEAWYRNLKHSSRIIFIYIRQPKRAREQALRVQRDGMKYAKAISLTADQLDPSALERILWFSFASKQDGHLLEIVIPKGYEGSGPHTEKKIRKRRRFKRHYILGAFLTVFVYSVIALAILLASSLMYLNVFSPKAPARQGAIVNLKNARALSKVGRALYRPVRPVFFFFSLGLFPDTLSDMNEQLDSLGTTYEQISENATMISRNVFIKQKNGPLKKQLSDQIRELETQVDRAIELSSILEQKIPHWNDQTETIRLSVSTRKDELSRLQELPPLIESAIAAGSRKKYLVLIADTTLTKPGGGLLPFFGVLMMSDSDIQSFEIYDSRAVDEVRDEPVETPSLYTAVSGATEYTLQNSLLSGDFKENYRQIVTLLEREASITGFDGGILLTDGGIQRIVSAYAPVYVPELKETITAENYLIKYQITPDKKVFTTTLLNELQRRAAQTPSSSLVPALITAFNEKQIVFLSNDVETAKALDSLYWSGIVPTPRCLIESFVCTANYVFPLMSNTGDNPVNRFISKTMNHQLVINGEGNISNTFTMRIQNSSLAEVYPGGTYKTYMQLIIPAGSTLKNVMVGGTRVEPEIVSSSYSIVGFPFELPAQTTKEIKATYELDEFLPKTKSIYQFIFQKQIGSPNSDIALELVLPHGATVSNRNFSPVVKNGRVFYNTVLDADKLFVLEIDNSIP